MMNTTFHRLPWARNTKAVCQPQMSQYRHTLSLRLTNDATERLQHDFLTLIERANRLPGARVRVVREPLADAPHSALRIAVEIMSESPYAAHLLSMTEQLQGISQQRIITLQINL